MAYPHTKYERQFFAASGGILTATVSGAPAEMHIIGRPHIVRGFYVAALTTSTGGTYAAGVWGLTVRDANATTLSTIGVINGAAGNATATFGLTGTNVLYKEGLNVTVKPGQALRLNVDTAAAGDAAAFASGVYLEPTWEVTTNDSNMALTT